MTSWKTTHALQYNFFIIPVRVSVKLWKQYMNRFFSIQFDRMNHNWRNRKNSAGKNKRHLIQLPQIYLSTKVIVSVNDGI